MDALPRASSSTKRCGVTSSRIPWNRSGSRYRAIRLVERSWNLSPRNPQRHSTLVQAAMTGDIDIIGPECAVPLTTPLANVKVVTARRCP